MTAAAAAAAPGDHANDFARELTATIAAGGPTAAKVSSPAAPASAQTVRIPEPIAPSEPQQQATPLREIAVRIATPQSPAVDLHVTERAGQIHVAVRTADGGLQTSLRQDLGTLVNSLERSGYRAEAFAPRDNASPLTVAAASSQNSRQESESGSSGGQREFGNPSQNSGEGQQQQRRDRRPSNWIEELENQQ